MFSFIFTDENSEVERTKVACQRSQSQEVETCEPNQLFHHTKELSSYDRSQVIENKAMEVNLVLV